jgi:cysteine-rich repeat protein
MVMKSLVAVCAASLFFGCGDNLTVPPGPVAATSAMALRTDEGVAVGFAVAATGTHLHYSMSTPKHGVIAGNGPAYIYTPVHDWYGVEKLHVTISDGVESVGVSVAITVVAADVAPVANIDTFITNENTPLVLPWSAFLANDVAYDPSLLSIFSVGDAAHGTVALGSDSVTFTPDPHFSGTAGFHYTVTDGMRSAVGSVGVAVQFVDDAPVAADDTATTVQDTQLSSPMSTLVANDTDDDGQTLAITAVGSAANCDVAISGTDIVVTPDAGYVGSAAFVYTVSDGTLTADATVTVTVTAAPGPHADDQSVTVAEGSAVAITLTGTDAAYFFTSTQAAHGRLSGNAPDLTYTPNRLYSGSDSFQFMVYDSQFDLSNLATVSITVTHVATCGDGIVDPGEQCDDGNLDPADGCKNDCTIGTVCGDGHVDAGEQCDDGNTIDGDGCSHLCVTETCGDGNIDLGLGETCDDGNTVDGDGCDAQCHVEPWTTTAPVEIAVGCTSGTPNASREVAVDASGTIYAVMLCGTSASIVVSTDHGNTFSAPMDLGETTVALVAVGAGAAGHAYVGMLLQDGTVELRRTSDHGATFSGPQVLGASVDSLAGLSLEAFNDTVYVGFIYGAGVAVMRSFDDGVSFEETDVVTQIVFFDVLWDRIHGTVIVATDTPQFHIHWSNDQGPLSGLGATFSDEVDPPGFEYYSDWGIGNGSVYVSGCNLGAGNSNGFYVMPTSDLSTSTFITGLPAVNDTFQTRTTTAAIDGDAFFGTQLDAGGVELDRFQYGASALDAPRTISTTGTGLVIGSLPGSAGAVVEYVDQGALWVSVQAY